MVLSEMLSVARIAILASYSVDTIASQEIKNCIHDSRVSNYRMAEENNIQLNAEQFYALCESHRVH